MKEANALKLLKGLFNWQSFDYVETVGNDIASAKKTIQAFFNTEGGIIVFGIDRNRNYVPCVNLRYLEKNLNSFLEELNDYEEPCYTYCSMDDKDFLMVEVERLPLSKLPCRMAFEPDTKALYRKSGNNVLIPYSILHAYKAQKGLCNDERGAVTSFRAKYDSPVEFEKFAKQYCAANNIQSTDLKAKVIDFFNLTKNQKKTMIYVLSFSLCPQMYYPNLTINVYDVSTGRKVIIDKIDGSISSMFRKAILTIKKNTKYHLKLHNGKVVEQSVFPLDVIKELLFNSLVHRDYSQPDEPIRIYISDSTLEIVNPGLVIYQGDFNLSKIKFSRNPFIKKVNELILEEQGIEHGYENIRKNCTLKGYDFPVIESKGDIFSAKLIRNDDSGIYRGNLTVDKICAFCSEPKSKAEIYKEFCGDRSKKNNYSYFFNKYIFPLIQNGTLKYLMPDKPISKKQKIYTSEHLRKND